MSTVWVSPLVPGVTHEVVLVTPHLAKEWLGLNRRNRRLTEAKVRSYQSDLTAGDWEYIADCIRFDGRGNLIDGQHRLTAIVETSIPAYFLVVRGLSDTAQSRVDTGKPRDFRGSLDIADEKATAHLASITRAANLWTRGYRREVLGMAFVSPTIAEQHHTLTEHPYLREVAEDASRLYRGANLSPTVLGIAMFATLQVAPDPEQYRYFFERLSDGAGISKGEPVFELRRALGMMKDNPNARTNKVRRLAYVIKAWNAYRQGNCLYQLKWADKRTGAKEPEKFPEPI